MLPQNNNDDSINNYSHANVTFYANKKHFFSSTPLSQTYDIWSLCIVAPLLIALTLWTILGNGLVLISLAKYPALRSISNCLIGNLAISDFLLALTVFPLSVSNDLQGHWIFGSVVCSIWLSIDVLYCTASIWSLVAIAFDRFTATTFPVWYREQKSTSRVAVYCGVVWTLSALICLPPLVGWSGSEFQDPLVKFAKSYSYDNTTGLYQCILFSETHYVVYSALGSFIIPLIIMLALYARIFAVLRRISRMHESKNKQRRSVLAASTAATQNKKQSELRQVPTLSVTDTSYDTRVQQLQQRLTSNQSARAVTDDAGSGSSHGYCNNELRVAAAATSHCSLDAAADKFTSDDGEMTSNEARTLLHHNLDSSSNEATNTSNRPFLFAEYSSSCLGGSGCSVSTRSEMTHQVNHKLSSVKKKMRGYRTAAAARKGSHHCSGAGRMDKREARATKRMALIIFLFVLCWIPFTFMYIGRSFCDAAATCPQMPHLQMFVIWLGYANSGLNPLLYTIFNEDFRRAFNRLLRCK